MMYPESCIEKLLHLFVPRRCYISTVKLEAGMFAGLEGRDHAFLHRHLFDLLSRLNGFLPGVNKDHDLVTVSNELGDLALVSTGNQARIC